MFALILLAGALARLDTFWRCVAEVRAGADALATARRFGGGGKRDEVIAWFLRRAAAERGTRERGYQAMIRVACAVPVEECGARGTYLYRPDFRATIWNGSIYIALRGAGYCLVCGAERPPTRQRQWGTAGAARDVRANYCDAHEAQAFEEGHERREEEIRCTFDVVRVAQRAAGP